MGVPGFPGTDGVPVSKDDTQLLLSPLCLMKYILITDIMWRSHCLVSLFYLILTPDLLRCIVTFSIICLFEIYLIASQIVLHQVSVPLSLFVLEEFQHPGLSVGSPWSGG